MSLLPSALIGVRPAAARRNSGLEAGVLAGADEQPDAVVVLRASHRDGKDVFGLCRPGRVDRGDPERAHEEGGDGRRDGDVQLARVSAGDGQRILDRRDDYTPAGRVAILRRLIPCAQIRVVSPGIHLARQEDGAGERRGVCGALHPERVRPVPGDIDHDSGQPDEDEGAYREDDEHLASRPPTAAVTSVAAVLRGRRILVRDLLLHRLVLSLSGSGP